MIDEIGGTYARRRWLPFIAPRADQEGPVHLRHAAHLAAGDFGELHLPWSSIMYPANTRYNACRSFGIDPDFGACAEMFDSAVLRTLQVDLERPKELGPARMAAVVALLNCLSEQRLIPDLVEHLPDGYDDRDTGMVWYQAARGLSRLGIYDEFVVDRLTRIGDATTPDVALNALIQLTSIYLRVARDVDRAAGTLQTAEQRLAALDRASPLGDLLESRFHRVRALHLIRTGDPPGAAAAMTRCTTAADALNDRADATSRYVRLLAEENYKIVCEAWMKLAGVRRRVGELCEWATALIRVDPFDVMTWRNVADSLISVGATTAARRAILLFTAMGGHDPARLTATLRSAHPDSAEHPVAPHAFQETLDHAVFELLP